MVNYDSNIYWSTEDVICSNCYKAKRGIDIQNIQMKNQGISLKLCADCLKKLADTTADKRSSVSGTVRSENDKL